jgi:hypothetical protein
MINRDAAFWDGIANHEAVAPHVFMGKERHSLAPLVEDPKVLPLASENGGIMFVAMDLVGLVREMHTMYRPEGWGREVAEASKRFMCEAFKHCALITTHEQEGHYRSKPPKCHGWKPAGEYTDVGLPIRLRLWILTREAWYASPAGRKMSPCP